MSEQSNTTGGEAMKLYAERDHKAQGDWYWRHISAMTSECLHDKSAIAAELAHRDIQIEHVEAERDAERNAKETILATATEKGRERERLVQERADAVRDMTDYRLQLREILKERDALREENARLKAEAKNAVGFKHQPTINAIDATAPGINPNQVNFVRLATGQGLQQFPVKE